MDGWMDGWMDGRWRRGEKEPTDQAANRPTDLYLLDVSNLVVAHVQLLKKGYQAHRRVRARR